jgi:AcrR family transcriptional regulator
VVGVTTTQAPPDHRQRLLDGLAVAIEVRGYRDATVADIVREAKTSRRTFYEHFASKETCFVALITEANDEMIRLITAAVDSTAPWPTQVRQAVETWLACADAERAVTRSWIRDVPALGRLGWDLQRDLMERFVRMVRLLTERAAGIEPADRELTIVLLGGLRELIASTVEDGRPVTDITESAVRAAIALLGPAT